MAKPQQRGRRARADERSRTAAAARCTSVRGKAPAEGPLALDRLIHERLRLGILSALAANDSLTFNDLKKLMQTTDGNLSVHARKLEEAKYITCTKSFEGRVPKTEYRSRPSAGARSSGTSTTWKRSFAPRASGERHAFNRPFTT